MDEGFDQFVQQLQDQVYEETRAEFGEIVYNRWREPKYMGRMDLADAHARMTGSCGDTMEMFLRFKDGRVEAASFLADGCGPSVVCGSYAAELSLGKRLEELLEIRGDVILNILGGLPEEYEHCAFLAAQTLQQAVCEYRDRQKK